MENSTYKVYEDEIQLLEEEIKLLAEKYDDVKQESTFYSNEEILTSIKLFQREFQGESKGQECPSDLKAQLESLEREISFLMKFTGIQFTSHSKKTLEKNENRTVQKHRLSGNCHSLPFQLEFQLLETQNKENVSAVITDLSIIMESGEHSDLSKFVSSTEEHGNLLLFFRSLSSYAEWYEHRRCTFLHFKMYLKYSKLSSCSEMDTSTPQVPMHSAFGREQFKWETCVTLAVLSAKHKKQQYTSVKYRTKKNPEAGTSTRRWRSVRPDKVPCQWQWEELVKQDVCLRIFCDVGLGLYSFVVVL
ncbi:centromere protein P isoform X2 [Cygnus atratus]|uniref:centromere protein P isoform X2 n=1 Tax=Cygnus atratus TaxID=8868 RepID=UPI0021B78192|nr:centromere protein P isoform X2 [Cygnus atratus]